MKILQRDHARLAALLGTTPEAVAAAVAKLAAERAAAAPAHTARIIAAVEATTGINLRAHDRRPPSDVTRALAYWLCHKQGVEPAELGSVIGRSREVIYRALRAFDARLLAGAALRARATWAANEVERRVWAAVDGGRRTA